VEGQKKGQKGKGRGKERETRPSNEISGYATATPS